METQLKQGLYTEIDDRHQSIISVVSAITACLDGENIILKDRRLSELQYYSTKKSRLLYELTRIVNSEPDWRSVAGLREKIEELEVKLARNARSLTAQASAIRSVAELVISEIRDSENDGTYSISPVDR